MFQKSIAWEQRQEWEQAGKFLKVMSRMRPLEAGDA